MGSDGWEEQTPLPRQLLRLCHLWYIPQVTTRRRKMPKIVRANHLNNKLKFSNPGRSNGVKNYDRSIMHKKDDQSIMYLFQKCSKSCSWWFGLNEVRGWIFISEILSFVWKICAHNFLNLPILHALSSYPTHLNHHPWHEVVYERMCTF